MSTNITPPSLPKSGATDSAELPVAPDKKRLQGKWVEPFVWLSPAGIWLVLLLVLPTLVIFELSLVPNIKPGMVVNPSGLDNYIKVFSSTNVVVMGRSLFFAVGTMLICLILGFPVAYWIALMAPKRWQNLLLLGFILPLWTSSLLRSYAWITILRPTGVLNTFLLEPLAPFLNPLLLGLNKLLHSFNLVLENWSLPPLTLLELLPWNILNEWPAVLIGMAYSYLPYMVLILYASLEKLDKRLLEASADLGANPIQTFWKVTVPQTLPGIAAGSLLVFISGLGDFVDPELLGGASSMTGARLIYNQFLGSTPNWGFGSALSMVLIAAVSIAIALLIKYGDREAASQR